MLFVGFKKSRHNRAIADPTPWAGRPNLNVDTSLLLCAWFCGRCVHLPCWCWWPFGSHRQKSRNSSSNGSMVSHTHTHPLARSMEIIKTYPLATPRRQTRVCVCRSKDLFTTLRLTVGNIPPHACSRWYNRSSGTSRLKSNPSPSLALCPHL